MDLSADSVVKKLCTAGELIVNTSYPLSAGVLSKIIPPLLMGTGGRVVSSLDLTTT